MEAASEASRIGTAAGHVMHERDNGLDFADRKKFNLKSDENEANECRVNHKTPKEFPTIHDVDKSTNQVALSNEKDVEQGNIQQSPIDRSEFTVVTWEGENDKLNPKNWSTQAKWTVTLIFSAYDFLTLISSSMIAPALPAISDDLRIQSSIEVQMVFSAFILAGVAGPLIFSPLSEMYGRKIITQAANTVFIVFIIVCGFAQTKSTMIVGRAISGWGGSVVFGVSQGAVGDCWHSSERGRSLAVLSFIPLCGPALGPIIGGIFTQETNWRWIFWTIAMLSGIVQLLAMFFLRETYAPVILARKAKRLRKDTSDSKFRAEHEILYARPLEALGAHLLRPLIIMTTHPSAAILTAYSAFNFGVLYIILSSFASLWSQHYRQAVSVSGLHYLAIVLGFILGSQTCALAMDRIWRRVSRKRTPTPELRAALMVPGSAFWAVGLLLYGWGAERYAHWVVVDAGAVILGIGAQFCTTSVVAYFIDSYGMYTASAMAGTTTVRSLFAFAFPLFTPQMYQALGFGWGSSLLAFICLGLGFIVPALIWKFGALWRERSRLTIG